MGVTITSAFPVNGGDLNVWGAELVVWATELVTKLSALAPTNVGLSLVPNVDARARSTHTGTQVASTVSDLAEVVQDMVAAMLTGNIGAQGISATYDDTAGTITLAFSGTPSAAELDWDGTGSCPARSVATSNPAQRVNWNTPTISTPPNAGGIYALENDRWYYGA